MKIRVHESFINWGNTHERPNRPWSVECCYWVSVIFQYKQQRSDIYAQKVLCTSYIESINMLVSLYQIYTHLNNKCMYIFSIVDVLKISML